MTDTIFENRIEDEIIKYNECIENDDRRKADKIFDKICDSMLWIMCLEYNKMAYRSFISQDSFVQDLRIELWKALPKFDHSKGIQFITFFASIIRNYKSNLYANKESRHNGIRLCLPEWKKNSTVSYDDTEGDTYKTWQSLPDNRQKNTRDSIDCAASIDNMCNLDALDKLILSAIATDPTTVNKTEDGRFYISDHQYISDCCDIKKTTLYGRLQKFRKMNIIEQMTEEARL